MRSQWRRLIAWADAYYDRDWRAVWFQPLLGLFIFGVSLRLALEYHSPPNFNQVFGFDFYQVWLILGMVSPFLMLMSWLLIREGGRVGVMGRSVRLGADVGVFTVLLSYHAVTALSDGRTESLIFSRYILAAVMFFVMELILRDLWAIRLVERGARELHHDR